MNAPTRLVLALVSGAPAYCAAGDYGPMVARRLERTASGGGVRNSA